MMYQKNKVSEYQESKVSIQAHKSWEGGGDGCMYTPWATRVCLLGTGYSGTSI